MLVRVSFWSGAVRTVSSFSLNSSKEPGYWTSTPVLVNARHKALVNAHLDVLINAHLNVIVTAHLVVFGRVSFWHYCGARSKICIVPDIPSSVVALQKRGRQDRLEPDKSSLKRILRCSVA